MYHQGGNYPPTGNYPSNYPPSSGPPPPPGAYGGGYGGYQQGYQGPPGFGGGYGGAYGGGYQSAYGGAGYGHHNPAAVPGFTAPPMPPSMQYNRANAAYQPAMGAQMAMMQDMYSRTHPNDPTVQELMSLRSQVHQQRRENKQQEDAEKDKAIEALTQKMNQLSEMLLQKGAEEGNSDSDMKKQLRSNFINELRRREKISGTFEDCTGTIFAFEEYDDDDVVTKYFQTEKGENIVGEKWDAEYDAECMRKGIRGWGTDEEKIIQISATRSNAQRSAIYDKYKTMYGKDLVKDLIGDLSGNLRETIVALYRRPAFFDAYCVKKAIYGLGTDEASLIEIFMTRTKDQIKEMKEEYNGITYEKQKDTSVSIEKDIEGDTSGDFKKLLISASTGNRDSIDPEKLEDAVEDLTGHEGVWTGMFKVNYDKLVDMKRCQRQAKELLDAGEERWGTDEETFNRIFSIRDMYSLRQIYNEYVKLSQRDILNSVDRETSGNFRKGLQAIAQSVKCRPMFFAERLRASMKGLGTDDTTLIRIVVSRSEIDLVQIKQCFLELTKQTLWNFIKHDTSGDYKKLLLAIVGRN